MDLVINQMLKPFLIDEDLTTGLNALEEVKKKYPYLNEDGEIAAIRQDYKLLLDYMDKNVKDPERQKFYASFCQRGARVASSFYHQVLLHDNASFRQAKERVAHINFRPESVRHSLEDFVADVAMLELESPEERQKKSEEIYTKHQHQLSLLFDHILVSPLWDEETESFYDSLLTSPTIDSRDACLLVSAIMLACMNCFDVRKWLALTTVYEKANDEALRQRAFVGWVFALSPLKDYVYQTVRHRLNELFMDPALPTELLYFQEQYYFCISAGEDGAKIRKNIIPGVMQNAQFDVTPNGVKEKEDDELEGILHPEAADEKMENMEKAMGKISSMAKEGRDIYFGGFSQMKRFGFFYTLSNWFVPFYLEHPDLKAVHEKVGDSSFLQNLDAIGPFCDSDKYSFALAMMTVIDRLPEDVRNMMKHTDLSMIGEMKGIDSKSGAYLRRSYLQDLFRFYLLYSNKLDFVSPFLYDLNDDEEIENTFPFCNIVFQETPLKKEVMPLVNFLLKHKEYYLAARVLEYWESMLESTDFHLAYGYCLHVLGKNEQAYDNLITAEALSPESHDVCKLLGEVSYELNIWPKAYECYHQLTEWYPHNWRYSLKLAVSEMEMGQFDDALQRLYQLDFEHENEPRIMSELAWVLLHVKKTDEARKTYDRLFKAGHKDSEDIANYAYTFWFSGEYHAAANLFRSYLKAVKGTSDDLESKGKGATLIRIFHDDQRLMDIYHISWQQMCAMRDLTML